MQSETYFVTGQILSGVNGRYRIEYLLAQAGMGQLYVATEETSQREVAIKRITNLGRSEHARHFMLERFAHEIEVLKSLSHARIPAFVDYIAEDCFALELVDESRSLQGLFYVDEFVCKRVDARQAIEWAIEICGVLLYLLVEKGLIYGDLNSRNVLVRNGKIYLVDLGAAVELDPSVEFQAIEMAAFYPGFGAPEIVGEGASTTDDVICARSDVYSLGALIHELLSGKTAAWAYEHGYAPLDLEPQFKALAGLVEQMLDPDFNKRPHLWEARDRLAEILAQADAQLSQSPSPL